MHGVAFPCKHEKVPLPINVFLSSGIVEGSHIRFLVWERKIAVQISLTLSLFNGMSLETGKIICCKKERYEGSVMRCQK